MKTVSLRIQPTKTLTLTVFILSFTVSALAQNDLRLFPLQGNSDVRYYAGRRGDGYFTILLFNEDRHPVDSITVTRSRTFVTLQIANNGSAFAVAGYDKNIGVIEVIAFDNGLRQIGVTQRIIKNYPLAHQILQCVDEGFAMFTIDDRKFRRYRIELFDNKLKTLSVTRHVIDDRYEEHINSVEDAKTIACLIEKRKKRNGRDFEYRLQANDRGTEENLFSVPVVIDSNAIAVSYLAHDTIANEYTVFGEYYDPKAHIGVDRSLGFMSIVYDSLGKVKSHTAVPWKDMSRFVPPDKKKMFESKRTDLYIHNIVRTSDGQMFVIGELFRKVPSTGKVIAVTALLATAILVTIYVGPIAPPMLRHRHYPSYYYRNFDNLSGDKGNTKNATTKTAKIDISDLVVFRFAKDLTFDSMRMFPKKAHRTTVPKEMLTSPKFASGIRSAGNFLDYKFTQMSKDSSAFLVVYVDYDGTWSHRSLALLLGGIRYTPEVGFARDKFSVNRRSGQLYLHNTRTGYVEVHEYTQGGKKKNVRFEKVRPAFQ